MFRLFSKMALEKRCNKRKYLLFFCFGFIVHTSKPNKNVLRTLKKKINNLSFLSLFFVISLLKGASNHYKSLIP